MEFSWVATIPWFAWMSVVAVVGLVLWRADSALMLITRRRPRQEPKGRPADDMMWEVGEVFASGLSVPIIIISYDLKVRAYNRPAEDLTGRPYYAIHEKSFSLLLADEEEGLFKAWLDRYFKDYRDGDAAQMVGVRRPLTLHRADGTRRQVVAIFTHFGNGRGGIQIELADDQRKAA